MAIRQILWDWNGTLLDDLTYAIGVRNRTFPAFGLSCIESISDYHAQFTFPVRTYYERAGVTDENFDAVAHAWMDEYVRGCADVPLHADALATLALFKQLGLRQVILSASSKDVLLKQMEHYPLQGYFDRVLALSNIYATSKVAIGKAYLDTCDIAPEETLMLGDTLHDAEVARAIGIKCILVSAGHQSRETLAQAGVAVAASLTEAAEIIRALQGLCP